MRNLFILSTVASNTTILEALQRQLWKGLSFLTVVDVDNDNAWNDLLIN